MDDSKKSPDPFPLRVVTRSALARAWEITDRRYAERTARAVEGRETAEALDVLAYGFTWEGLR